MGQAYVFVAPLAGTFGAPLSRYFCKRTPVMVDPGILACKGLPAKYSHVDVGRVDFDRKAGAYGSQLRHASTTPW
jgi:hypothetical protein